MRQRVSTEFSIEKELKNDISFFHDVEKQRLLVEEKAEGSKIKSWKLYIKYRLLSEIEEDRTCCGETMNSDWDYCPHCGMGLSNGYIDITADCIDDIKSKYKDETGEVITKELLETVTAGYYIKIYYETENYHEV